MAEVPAPPQKRLSDAQRREALRLFSQGSNMTSIASRFGVSRASISKMIKKADEVLGRPRTVQPVYRLSVAKNPEVDEHVIRWMEENLKNNVRVTGTMLRAEALDFAQAHHMPDFKASEGWLRNFRRRYSIECKHGAGRGGKGGLVRMDVPEDEDALGGELNVARQAEATASDHLPTLSHADLFQGLVNDPGTLPGGPQLPPTEDVLSTALS